MKRKSQNSGLYIPEKRQADQIAAYESAGLEKPLTGGGLIRSWCRDAIRKWAKKNPSKPLDVS